MNVLLLWELLPIPDYVSDAVLLHELYARNDIVQTQDLAVVSTIFLTLSILFHLRRAHYFIQLTNQNNSTETTGSREVSAFLAYLGIAFLGAAPQLSIVSLYLDRQIKAFGEPDWSWPQHFSIATNFLTALVISFRWAYLTSRSIGVPISFVFAGLWLSSLSTYPAAMVILVKKVNEKVNEYQMPWESLFVVIWGYMWIAITIVHGLCVIHCLVESTAAPQRTNNAGRDFPEVLEIENKKDGVMDEDNETKETESRLTAETQLTDDSIESDDEMELVI